METGPLAGAAAGEATGTVAAATAIFVLKKSDKNLVALVCGGTCHLVCKPITRRASPGSNVQPPLTAPLRESASRPL